MADLHFVDFALILSPVRKEKHFRLPDDFSDSLTDEPFRVRFSRAFSSIHTTEWHGQTTRAKQEISTFPLSEVEIVAY